MAISVDTFFLNPNFQGTLQSQIQQIIAEAILSGRFRQGEKLPSTRKLATHLGISRITVTLAYTELLANDYLTSRGRSGFRFRERARATLLPRPETNRRRGRLVPRHRQPLYRRQRHEQAAELGQVSL